MAGVEVDVISRGQSFSNPQQPQSRSSVNCDRVRCCVFGDLTCREMTWRVGLEVKHQSIHILHFPLYE